MKFVSIDLESLGLAPHHSLIEFGAVIEDTQNALPLEQLPRFHKYILHDEYVGSAHAMNMHAKILTLLDQETENRKVGLFSDKFEYLGRLHVPFRKWLDFHGFGEYITVAGKNFGTCDKIWLDNQTKLSSCVKFSHRMLDPAVLFARPEDDGPPNLQTCLTRAALTGTVSHTAVEDAIDVIRLFRADGRMYDSQVQ